MGVKILALLLAAVAVCGVAAGDSQFLPRGEQQYAQRTQTHLEYVGSSYNSLIGNPLNSQTQDPGIMKQIFDFTYTEGKTTPDGKWPIPDQVQSELRSFCMYESEFSSYTGMQTYHSDVQKSINAGAGVGPLGFTLGREYRDVQASFSGKAQVQWSLSGSCEAYSQAVDTFSVQRLRQDFVDGLTTSFHANSWDAFIQVYGTHFIHRCVLGGRMSLLQTMDAAAYSTLEARGFQFSVGARGSYKKITARGSYSSQEERDEGELFYSKTTHSTVYFLGGVPPAGDNLAEWKDAVSDDPTAISYDLLPLYELVTATNFPGLDHDQVKNAMLTAFSSYCQRNGCAAPVPDPPFPPPAKALIVKTDLYGDDSKGNYFEDQQTTNPFMHICRIKFRCQADMDGLQLFICDGRGNELTLGYHGGNGGKEQDIVLPYNEFEYITGYTGTYYWNGAYKNIISFQFTTNTGRLIPSDSCGYHRGKYQFSGTAAGPIVGLYGKSHDRVDRLGFYGLTVSTGAEGSVASGNAVVGE